MQKIVFPGSFDPITVGHLDLIERLVKQNYFVIVGVATNISKKSLFSLEKRLKLIEIATNHLPNVEVKAIDQLVVDFCKENDCTLIARGIRTVHDFTSEQILAYSNFQLNKQIETIYLFTKAEYMHVSSSGVKELIKFEKSFAHLVPATISNLFNKSW